MHKLSKDEKLILVFSSLFLIISILFNFLKFNSTGPIQDIVYTPLAEEPLKFIVTAVYSIILLFLSQVNEGLRKLTSSQTNLSAFSKNMITFSFILGFFIGLIEYTISKSLSNPIGHLSLALITSIPMSIWILYTEYPSKYLGILFLIPSICFHSIVNQYAVLNTTTNKDSILVLIAKFLQENSISQQDFTFFIFGMAGFFVLMGVLFCLRHRK